VIILAFLEIGKTIALNIFSFALIQVYTNLKGKRAHAVNTGWAMLALIGAGQVCIVLAVAFDNPIQFAHSEWYLKLIHTG